MNKLEPNAQAFGDYPLDNEVSLDELSASCTELRDLADISADKETGTVSGEDLLQPVPVKTAPVKPIPLLRHVSGTYINCPKNWELHLRIDVDKTRPLKMVSGDFFRTSGSTKSYFGSFAVKAPIIRFYSKYVLIEGIAQTTWNTSYNKARVVIPRLSPYLPPPAATLQWMTIANRPGAKYTCSFHSPYFREVVLEQDVENGVNPFVSYNTGSLPSGGPARTLTIRRAYGEAGVKLIASPHNNVVLPDADGKWSNAELHDAMENQFYYWKDDPQWKVWYLHANKHDYGSGLLGIMFDQEGRQRQGCAGFYQSISGNAAVNQRYQLYVGVHELGHCFNLFHSFHKKHMRPPMPNRPDSLSWMNYPNYYTGGSNAFWNNFAFQFDDLEVAHLRHAFRNNIIFGGNPFGHGAAIEKLSDVGDHVQNNCGLELSVKTGKRFFHLGEPVFVELKLANTDGREKAVIGNIHPDFAFTEIAIEKPNGKTVLYHPMMEACIIPETVMLTADAPAIYDSAYIGYGKDGLIFDTPGLYKIKSVYYALDGSIAASNTLCVNVHHPVTLEDESMAELLLTDEVGMLMYLQGSDSAFLRKGNECLDKVIADHGDSECAVYAKYVKGINCLRPFKSLARDRAVRTRPADIQKAETLLNDVCGLSEKGKGLDNIQLNKMLTRQVVANVESGAKKKAKEAYDSMLSIFKQKKLKPYIMDRIAGGVTL